MVGDSYAKGSFLVSIEVQKKKKLTSLQVWTEVVSHRHRMSGMHESWFHGRTFSETSAQGELRGRLGYAPLTVKLPNIKYTGKRRQKTELAHSATSPSLNKLPSSGAEPSIFKTVHSFFLRVWRVNFVFRFWRNGWIHVGQWSNSLWCHCFGWY